MSLPWINITPKLLEGVALINFITKSKFNLLLEHIIKSENKELFTQPELAKLSESLKLDNKNAQLLVQSIDHIFKQSSKILLKPTTLQEQLIEKLNFNQEKAEEFVSRWAEETKKDFDIENSRTLDTITWELNLESASSCCSKENHLNTRLHLAIKSIDDTHNNHITLELNQENLENLYCTLENIQNKLDNI